MTDAQRRLRKNLYMKAYHQRRKSDPNYAEVRKRRKVSRKTWAQTPSGKASLAKYKRKWIKRNRAYLAAYMKAWRAKQKEQR